MKKHAWDMLSGEARLHHSSFKESTGLSCQSCVVRLVRRSEPLLKLSNTKVQGWVDPSSVFMQSWFYDTILFGGATVAQGLFHCHWIDWSTPLISRGTGIYNTISSSNSESNITPPHYLGLIVKQQLCILMESASTRAHSVQDDC